MRQASAMPTTLFFLVALLGLWPAYLAYRAGGPAGGVSASLLVLACAMLVGSATRVASQWERAVVLRLGRFQALRGPGLFFIIPIVDTVAYLIDVRVITSSL